MLKVQADLYQAVQGVRLTGHGLQLASIDKTLTLPLLGSWQFLWTTRGNQSLFSVISTNGKMGLLETSLGHMAFSRTLLLQTWAGHSGHAQVAVPAANVRESQGTYQVDLSNLRHSRDPSSAPLCRWFSFLLIPVVVSAAWCPAPAPRRSGDSTLQNTSASLFLSGSGALGEELLKSSLFFNPPFPASQIFLP